MITENQKEYILNEIGTSNSIRYGITKDYLKIFLDKHLIDYRKSWDKDKYISAIINSEHGEKFINEIAEKFKISKKYILKKYDIDYKTLGELINYELIPQADIEIDGYYYFDLSILDYDIAGALTKLEEKNKLNFIRSRFEVKDEIELDGLIATLSKVFEISSISKMYQQRDSDNYYVYLTIRAISDSKHEDLLIKDINNLKNKNSVLSNKVKEFDNVLWKKDCDIRSLNSKLELTEYKLSRALAKVEQLEDKNNDKE